jgi:hypothetical protein
MAATVESFEHATRGAKSTAGLEFLKRSPAKLLIGGKWVAAKSGKTFESINPANEEVLALVAEGDKADVDEAVKAARKAFEEGSWPAQTPHQRTRCLLKLAELVDKCADELAEFESLDNGKPVSQARVRRLLACAALLLTVGGGGAGCGPSQAALNQEIQQANDAQVKAARAEAAASAAQVEADKATAAADEARKNVDPRDRGNQSRCQPYRSDESRAGIQRRQLVLDTVMRKVFHWSPQTPREA